jgi:hypothetical protein
VELKYIPTERPSAGFRAARPLHDSGATPFMGDVRVPFRSSSGDGVLFASDGDPVTEQRHPNTDSKTDK